MTTDIVALSPNDYRPPTSSYRVELHSDDNRHQRLTCDMLTTCF
jgi:hypothetical protein